MKKRLLVAVVTVALLSYAGFAYADAGELMSGMGHKFFRGIVNTFTGWVELPMQIVKGYERGLDGEGNNKVVGAVVGIFTGIGHSAGRTLSGMGEVATFWAADPESNEGVGLPLDAEYAWEEGTRYDIFDPNLVDGAVKPVGNKLLRGIGNSLFGFVEFPGQIVKGIKEGAPDLGIIKGLWYWGSRQAEGAWDISTFILPNPEDTKALAYDEKWPWSALGDSMK